MDNKVYAQVIEGKVVDVSLWSIEPEDESLIEIPADSNAGIDWDYSNGKFEDNRPKQEQNPEAE
jgi:hypothetical protein